MIGPTTLVDTNVIIDIFRADPQWLAWSAVQLQKARAAGPVCINFVVYAELASHPQAQAQLDPFLDDLGISIQPITKATALAAALAFNRYRTRGGTKTGVLPDFFIGAQALTEGWTLLSRDKGRYATYFPGLMLTCPD